MRWSVARRRYRRDARGATRCGATPGGRRAGTAGRGAGGLRWYHDRGPPTPAQSLPGGRPLDPERPASDPARPAPEPDPTATDAPGRDAPRRDDPPPGLRAQVAATKEALLGFVRAHVDLAKAELDEIKGEIARAAALGAGAVASLILLSLLLAIGGMLFAGEWIFGSIGWGLLLGSELLVAVAVTMTLVALRVPDLGRDVVLALLTGAVVGLVLAFNLPNELFRRVGEAANLGIDPAVRPLAVGVGMAAILGGLAGLVGGLRSGGGAAIGGLVAGLVAGALLGAFLAITFGPRVGAALGVATFLGAWTLFEGLHVRREGIDTEALKARFYPATTIDTTKESIEWAKARVPRGPRS
jgi:hypothetical protein